MASNFRKILHPVAVIILPALISTVDGGAHPLQGSETCISPDMTIITEVSNHAPFAGQQFSIIYRLLAQYPPAAIDIDTQQFPGFWTEMLPLPEQPRQTTRMWRGKAVYDLLLRQIIAYPLFPGERQIPSLSLKIRRTLREETRAADDWDLRAKSDELSIVAKPLPESGPFASAFPLVGEVSGRMLAPGDSRSATLELESSANLALFDPQQWLKTDPGVIVLLSLLGSDRLVQTIDAAGQRKLSVKYRQQWRVSLWRIGKGTLRIYSVLLPYFHAENEAWLTSVIEGISLEQQPDYADASPASLPHSGEPERQKSDDVLSRRPSRIGRLIIVILSLFFLLVAWHIRKQARRKDRPERLLQELERKCQISPRAFLDGAGRLLNDCARRHNRLYDIGTRDETLDRCWILVEQCRFNVVAAPAEALQKILLYLSQLVRYEEKDY